MRMRRDQRRILEGAAVAAVLSGTPSSLHAVIGGSPTAALRQGLAATRAIGTLVAPGRPGVVRGAVVHLAISLGVGELLGATLPRRGSIAAGAAAGAGIGWLNLAVIARRRYPALAALPLGPQLADNAAFGAVFAAVADRQPSSPAARHRRS
jgi:hypothetical protein